MYPEGCKIEEYQKILKRKIDVLKKCVRPIIQDFWIFFNLANFWVHIGI